MANQSSCRMNRPGYPAAGRSMSGSGRQMTGRPMPGSGCSGTSRSMPAPGCSEDASRIMPGSGCSGSNRSMHDSNRPGHSGFGSSSPRNEARPQPYNMVREHRQDTNRSCSEQSSVTCVNTANFPVGMAYVPMQTWGALYDPQKALAQGTLFPQLDKPFLGGRGTR